MSLARDLLDQAEHLSQKEPTRPKQASLRRAVSAAYYSVFHLLTDSAARWLVRGADASRPAQRAILQRTFVHGHMKGVCAPWWGTKQRGAVHEDWQDAVGASVLSEDLQRVADAFVELHQARHEADYNVGRNFTRPDVRDLVRRAKEAFEAWARVRATGMPEGDAFLLALIVR